MLNTRRCCHKGCDQVCEEPPRDGWYKVGYGFMCWACPAHSAAWKAFDIARRKDESASGEAFEKACAEIEEQWRREYREQNPAPEPPYSQPSLIDG